MSVFVVGIDAASMTGVAILSANAVVDSWQDTRNAAMRRLIPWFKANREASGLFLFEDAFMGANAHSGLHVAKSIGICTGFLLCAGVPDDRIEEIPASEWRKDLGLKMPRAKKGEPKLPKGSTKQPAIDYAKTMTGRVHGEHEAEALCIAQVGWNMHARRYDLPLWRAR